MRVTSNITNDLLACRRGPAGRSFAAGATLDRTVRHSHPAQAFQHRNAFFVFGGNC
jgi:hypothetical protein